MEIFIFKKEKMTKLQIVEIEEIDNGKIIVRTKRLFQEIPAVNDL